MSLKAKSLLSLAIALLALYATAPYWLRSIVAHQLPANLQLKELEIGYPGLAGIRIRSLRIDAGLMGVDLSLRATGVQLDYWRYAADIDEVLLDARSATTDHSVTPGHLRLPVLPLAMLPSTRLPEFRIGHLQLRIRNGPSPAVTLDIQALRLVQSTEKSLHLAARVQVVDRPAPVAQVVLDASPVLLNASVRLPASPDSPAWLSARLMQDQHETIANTRLQVTLLPQAVDPGWISTVIDSLTDGRVKNFNGMLEARAVFSGQTQQALQSLEVTGTKLKVNVDEQRLAGYLLPGLKFQHSGPARAALSFAAEIHSLEAPPRSAGSDPVHANQALQKLFKEGQKGNFSASFKLNYRSDTEHLRLKIADLEFSAIVLAPPALRTADGLLELDWEINQPFSYHSTALDLSADRLVLATGAKAGLTSKTLELEQAGTLSLRLENLASQLRMQSSVFDLSASRYTLGGRLNLRVPWSVPGTPPGVDFSGPVRARQFRLRLNNASKSPPVVIQARELSIVAMLAANSKRILSNGSGVLQNVQVSPLGLTAKTVSASWDQLDLQASRGKLMTKTTGLVVKVDDETWPGFDLDVRYDLSGDTDVHGGGSITVDNKPLFPFTFKGNMPATLYHITLPLSSIDMGQLDRILELAPVPRPPGLVLNEGRVELQGEIVIGENISAHLDIEGQQLGLSLFNSDLRGGHFTLKSRYDSRGPDVSLSFNGPIAATSVSLAGGLSLQTLSAELGAEWKADGSGLLSATNLRAQLLNGFLDLPVMEVSPRGMQDSVLTLDGIDLGQLLAFADIDGLEGSGKLAINLPVGSDQHGIHIRNGTFQSSGPGRIAYSKEGLAGSNVGLRALENFEYRELSGTLDYQADGNYSIVVRLDGSNPDLYGGHAIVFTLDINGTIPEIFDALFFTGDFDEAILRQLKPH